MNRSVRNGLAIAGMAGGIFFLGQAVASADDAGRIGGLGTAATVVRTGHRLAEEEDPSGHTGDGESVSHGSIHRCVLLDGLRVVEP